MWLWKGEIVPQPGESIDTAASEAVQIARKWGAPGSKLQFFTLRFNDRELSVFPESSPQDVVAEYMQSIAPESKASGPSHAGEEQRMGTPPPARSLSLMGRTELVALIAAILITSPRWSSLDKAEAIRLARQILFQSEAQERMSPNGTSGA